MHAVLAQPCSVDGCVCSIHLATHPHFPKGHCSCCFVMFRRVFRLENETEEATIVQPNAGSARLGYTSHKCTHTRGCSGTDWGKLNSGVIPPEKTSDRKTGSLLGLGQNQNPNPDEPRVLSLFFLIKKLMLSEFRCLLKLIIL